MSDLLTFRALGTLELRADAGDGREVYGRLFEWGVPGETADGPEVIERGALDGLDLEARQVVFRADHLDPPTGRMTSLELLDDGPHATFRIANTARGDEQLELIRSGLHTGLSVGFVRAPYDDARVIDGRRVGVRRSIDLRETSSTWAPAHQGAAILAVRSGGDEVQESGTPVEPAEAADARLDQMVGLLDRVTELEERSRRDGFELPPGIPTSSSVEQQLSRRAGNSPLSELAGRWAAVALTALSGDRPDPLELRQLADVITTPNLGVVPDSVRSELIGIIDTSRPFLESTRQVPAGESGLKITFPRIVTRPVTGKQSAEKAEVASGATAIDTVEFSSVTIAGAGDLSVQLLRRSSPSFLNLWLELLAEQYALDADAEGVAVLLASGINTGTGSFDPASPTFGESWENAAAVGRPLRPNRIWLSTAGMVAFIDAKEPTGGGGRPLYPGLAPISGVTPAGGGAGPENMTMQPVWVPALDAGTVDVLIGPSRGLAWAEDGTFTLQADVPAKLGRDVALAGLLWVMPVYPGAFTSYALPAVGP